MNISSFEENPSLARTFAFTYSIVLQVSTPNSASVYKISLPPIY